MRLFVWVTALAMAAYIVRGTQIGPVIVVIDEERGYGVHVGDVWALLPLGAALVYTAFDSHRRQT